MKISHVVLMRRRTHASYEHEELTLHAEIDAEQNVHEQLRELGLTMEQALYPERTITIPVMVKETATNVEKVELKPLGNEPVATANIVKEKAAPRRAKAAPAAKSEDVLDNGQAIPPVIPEAAPSQNAGGTSTVVGSVDTANVTHVQSEAPKAAASVVGKGVVAYDATIKEHRSRFATYLGTNFPKWKTCRPEQEIKDFSKGLHGKAFEDAKGNMLDSFKADLEVFFASAK